MGKGNRRILLTPECTSTTLDLADGDPLTFRKKILPLATIDYPLPDGSTRKITFDRPYHQACIDAFKAKAYDAPTLQLADADNRHNMDPRLTYGHIIGLSHEQPGDVDGPGLYADVRALTPEHAKILRDNPKIGVSAQIREGRKRVDGARFRAAVRHVLATLDPRVVGLGEWRAVSLSTTDAGRVVDLTGTEYRELTVGAKSKRRKDDPTISLSEDEIEAALEEAARALDEADDDDEDEGDEPHVRRTDLSETGSNRRPRKPPAQSPSYVSLAAEQQQTRAELTGVQAELARAKFDSDKLSRWRGVPKAVLDLAEEVLAYPGEAVISLADEDADTFEVDARTVIEKMLDACPAIDLSEPAGSSHDPDAQATNEEHEKNLLKSWESQFPTT